MVKIGNIELGDFPLFLSPMDDVTDLPFRQICKRYGADVLISEFIASEALIRDAEKSRRKMLFSEFERPIGIQVFGSDEESMLRCIDVVTDVHPDFIDINWGCPVRKVAGKGAGSGMLKDLPKLLHITESLVKRSSIPVTVKTRLGYDENNKPIVTLAEQLQDVGVAAVSIHGRTKNQMYRGDADWTLIEETKANPRLHIPVFGNGDITTPRQALDAFNRYGVDGILIGRAAIGNPWIFGQTKELMQGSKPKRVSISDRVGVCREHLLAAVDFKGERPAVFEMRKHYSGYFHGLPNFKPFRVALVTASTVSETLAVLANIEENYQEMAVQSIGDIPC